MPRVPITDLDDPRIAIYRNLKATNRTRSSGQFVVEGEKLLDRLLASPLPVASVLAGARHEARVAAKVPPEVPLYVVPHELLDLLVGFNFHQGVLAAGVRCPGPGMDAIAAGLGTRATLIVCPRLDNPENLGALIRLGDVFGVDALLIGPRCPDPLSRRVLRVSMGMALRLPVLASESLERDLARLGASWGFTTVATTIEPDAEPLDAFRRPERLALVFGSEAAGLDPEWAQPLRPSAHDPDAPGGRVAQRRHRGRDHPLSRHPLTPQKRDRQQEGVLLVKAADPVPGGVLREEDEERVDEDRREHHEPAGPPEDPVAGLLPPRRAGIGPARQDPGREDEGEKDEARQPDRFAGDHLDLEQVQRQREQRRQEQGQCKRPGSPAEPLPHGPVFEQRGEPPLGGEVRLQERQHQRHDGQQQPPQQSEHAAPSAPGPGA